MKRRALWPWVLFGVSVAVVVAAASWITGEALRLDRHRAEERRRVERAEKIRTALWRMDSYVAPLLAAESAWPLYAIRPVVAELPDGGWTSRQYVVAPPAPAGEGSTGPQQQMQQAQSPQPQMEFQTQSQQAALFSEPSALDYAEIAALVPEGVSAASVSAEPQQRAGKGGLDTEKLDYSNRFQQNTISQQAFQNIVMNSGVPLTEQVAPVFRPEAALPVWYRGDLLLAARTYPTSGSAVRASVIEWAPLRAHLARLAEDLLPGLELVAAQGGEAGESYPLASLPVRLEVPEDTGPVPRGELRTAVAVAWGGIGAGIVAFACLLGGVMSLSERRHRFVSSVTHELRTPLTTFQLYSEMLRDGMVPEERWGEYLETLRREAVRLHHLVENVLAYARLERRGVRGRCRVISLGELISLSRERLEERAEGCGMRLEVSLEEEEVPVLVDPAAVEQILFNLVDNACKYAGEAENRRIEVSAGRSRSGRGVEGWIRVRDYGTGFAKSGRRLFRPFSVSAEEAARRAKPGVGLGLELSRQLAHAMGGGLRVERRAMGSGACIVLRLRGGPRATLG